VRESRCIKSERKEREKEVRKEVEKEEKKRKGVCSLRSQTYVF
jgi:hypothetical protein